VGEFVDGDVCVPADATVEGLSEALLKLLTKSVDAKRKAASGVRLTDQRRIGYPSKVTGSI
jgi:hypothetical protein